jgi:RNA polymerase sigma-70 factor (ECF subfamily)
VQEVFLRAWRRIDELADMAEQSRRAWLYAVARNLLTDHYRAAATCAQTNASLQAAAASVRIGPVDPAGLAETADEVELVGAAIRALPPEQRLILTMHAVGEMNSSQIGEALEQPAGTIRYKLSTARRALARALASHEHTEAHA